jgi:metal-responsive CopG/Arc/MetJ family transcriptional regulator
MKRKRIERKRIHIMLPVKMVNDLEQFARSRGISRSAAIASLLPPHIGMENPDGQVREGTGGAGDRREADRGAPLAVER